MIDAPTVDQLLEMPIVQQALEQAWIDSQPDAFVLRHEEGGWIYVETDTGVINVRRATSGTQAC